MHLADAPGGAAYQTASAETLRKGKMAFADKCARCHSSKQPPQEIATDRVKVEAWYRESVLSPDFLDKNFLSDDKRYPVYQLGTNIARAAGTRRDADPHHDPAWRGAAPARGSSRDRRYVGIGDRSLG